MPIPGTVWRSNTWDADAWAANTWQGAEAITGQSPPASRFRFAYQLSDVIRMVIVWL